MKAELLARIDAVKKAVSYKEVQRQLLLKKLDELDTALYNNETALSIKKKTHKLLELFIKSTEYGIREYIEPLITEGFVFVFEQDLFFHLYFSSRRNQLEIDFIILRTKAQEEEYQKYIADQVKYHKKLEDFIKAYNAINDEFGGAVNQVLGVLLKVIIAEMLHIEGPLLFDEPTSMVSEAYAGRLGKLLSSLSHTYNRQYSIITHSAALAACGDKKYNVTLNGKISEVKEIEE
jgi:hypothetical protein